MTVRILWAFPTLGTPVIVTARILIVDDNPAVAGALRNVFHHSGDDWEVCGAAEDGKAGIEAAKSLKPDLVVMDLSMPRMNGLEAATEIRKIFPDMPILMYTMFGSVSLEHEAKRAGINRVVSKSSSADLVVAARELMSA
jgi:DNA-binding NarL/FixJ family response regulator